MPQVEARHYRRNTVVALACLVFAIALAWGASASAAESQLPLDPSVLLPGDGTFDGQETAGEGAGRTAPQVSVAEDLAPGEGRYIVVLKDSIKHPATVADAQAEEVDADVGLVYRSALKGYSASLPQSEVESLRDDPRVKYVVRDQVVKPFAQTIPTGVDRTYASNNPSLDIDGVDDVRVNADVAIIDTGIDSSHPDLNVSGLTDCTVIEEEVSECEDETGSDGYGHGTHVAGIVGALDNGIGAVGVAPGARLWSVKVLNEEGSGLESWIVGGIDWVTAHASTIEVANMSLGCRCTMPAVEEAVDASVESGVVYVVAAGNSHINVSNVSPARNPNAITVSALADYDGVPGGVADPTCSSVGADDHLASFSNFGSGVDVAAPGVCIYSTLPTGEAELCCEYGLLNGTSMAAPHVAGAAAIIASESNPKSQEDVEEIRDEIVEDGNLYWSDTSKDGTKEPLLAVGPPNNRPAAKTRAPAGATETSARLAGIVSPNGKATTYWFEYGTSTSYGTGTSHKEAGAGLEAVRVIQEISGLSPSTEYHFRFIAENAAGKLIGSDRVFSTAPELHSDNYGESGSKPGQLAAPTFVAVDESVNWDWVVPGAYWVADSANDTIQRFNHGGRLLNTLGESGTGPEQLDGPTGIEINPYSGELFVSDTGNDRIVVYGANIAGEYIYEGAIGDPDELETEEDKEKTPEFDEPMGLAFAPSPGSGEGHGGLLVADAGADRIQYIDWDNWRTAGTYGTSGSGKGQLDHPTDISLIDEYEEEGVVQARYAVVDSGNDRVQIVDGDDLTSTVSYVTEFGKSGTKGGEFSEPTSAALDPSTGNISVTDTGNNRVEQFLPDGSFIAQLGSGPGEGNKNFNGPLGIAYRDAGTAYVVDGGNDRVSLWKPGNPRPWPSQEKTSQITAESALVTAMLNPKGPTITAYRVEYSPVAFWYEEEPYGSSTKVANIEMGSDQDYEIATSLKGLYPNTTYRYRISATNGYGNTKGEDKRFTTLSAPPVTSTESATDIGAGRAVLHGFVDPRGTQTSYYFEYGLTSSYGTKAPVPGTPEENYASLSGALPNASESVGWAISELSPETTYHYRIVASNSAGTAYGGDKTVTTKAPGPPATITGTNTSPTVKAVEASVHAKVNPEGLATTYRFEYGKTTSYGSTMPVSPKAVGSGTGDVVVDETITGLAKATTYHYRISATNSAGTTTGSDKSFTTLHAPAATTEAASGVTGTRATLNATINPEGRYAAYRFEYGPTTAYGSEYPGEPGASQISVGNGTSDVKVSASIKGLTVGTTYHYRVRAAGDEYFTYGEDKTFTTNAEGPPLATTSSAAGVKTMGATLRGTVNPNGYATTYSFEYGKTTSYGTKAPTSPASAGSGKSAVSVGEVIAGLTAGTTYHYRLVATSEEGVSYGSDKTLTTASLPTEPSAYWYLDAGTFKGPEAFTATGELSVSGLGVTFGPCEAEFEGSVSNGAKTAEGQVSAGVGLNECATTLPGCEIEEVTQVSPSSLPLTATYPGQIHIGGNLEVSMDFQPGCAAFGFTNTTVAGTVSGQFDNETKCVEFTKGGGMEITDGSYAGSAMSLSGELCLEPGSQLSLGP
jgi:subtilisin family serine protease